MPYLLSIPTIYGVCSVVTTKEVIEVIPYFHKNAGSKYSDQYAKQMH
jgi:hypothetical protein